MRRLRRLPMRRRLWRLERLCWLCRLHLRLLPVVGRVPRLLDYGSVHPAKAGAGR